MRAARGARGLAIELAVERYSEISDTTGSDDLAENGSYQNEQADDGDRQRRWRGRGHGRGQRHVEIDGAGGRHVEGDRGAGAPSKKCKSPGRSSAIPREQERVRTGEERC